MEELCDNKVALALPGCGNICHREIEAFGLSTPVLMPRLKNRLYEDLIPDHHYISVDVDTKSSNANHAADRIEEWFRQVKGDPPY